MNDLFDRISAQEHQAYAQTECCQFM